jgi:hypothetical protein
LETQKLEGGPDLVGGGVIAIGLELATKKVYGVRSGALLHSHRQDTATDKHRRTRTTNRAESI